MLPMLSAFLSGVHMDETMTIAGHTGRILAIVHTHAPGGRYPPAV
jgi:hypothetical protein